ncbi:uncharacterized protein [Drosophila tropicalis]|uniref:uncharacterized protein n=1 Tax=Drosophila tropicalis TaxID=46794 RepID=UPI0035ABE092
MYTAFIRIQQQHQQCNCLNVSRFSCILNQFKLMGQQKPKVTLVKQMQEPARFFIKPHKLEPRVKSYSTSTNKEDFRIYQQNIDLDAFFGEEQKYEKVSDVCLVNDHFILVKMPPMCKEPTSNLSASTADAASKKSKLPRCFKCSRSSRISPIIEDEEKLPQKSTKIPNWKLKDQDEIEVFDSMTRLTLSYHEEQPLKIDALQSTTHVINRAPVHWFLWPFRWRSVSKSKPQLAAIHKTYFVKWAKPPKAQWQGYGVDKLKNYNLRRCRSSIF